MNKKNLYNKSIGAFFGLAAGDKIGGPIGMSLVLAQHLLKYNSLNTQKLLNEYLTWREKGGCDTGPIAARVFSLVKSGTNPDMAVKQTHDEVGQETAGCNPMHRSLPLAIANFIPLDKIDIFSEKEAGLTHFDKQAGIMAGYSNKICRLLLLEKNPLEAVRLALQSNADFFIADSRKELKRTGYSVDVLKAAIYFLLHNNSFTGCLNSAIKFSGPTNHVPVIVGCWAGAQYGFSDIPKEYYNHCKILSKVAAIAKQFGDLVNRDYNIPGFKP